MDIGAAYTSACALVEGPGETFTIRIPTNSGELITGVENALSGLCDKSGLKIGNLSMLMLGSTAFHPAITPGRVSKTALLVTRGFRDILYTGGRPLPYPYNLWEIDTFPPVGRGLTFEISERVLPGGQVVTPLADNEIINLLPVLKKAGIESVAVCFLHSYEYPLHEQRVKLLLSQNLPGIPVTLSSDILPAAGESERAFAAAANAYARPLVADCLNGLKKLLTSHGKKNTGIFFLQPDGSAITSRQASEESARAALSGPAGGFLACADLAKSTGRPNIIAFDMGAKGSRFGLIHRDQSGSSGPGSLRDHFQGFSVREFLTVPLGGESMPEEQAALKIVESADKILAKAVKSITIAKGHDPREYTLVAFGSAGPLHAAKLAANLGIPRVLVPLYPGTHSALGMFYADLRKKYSAALNSAIEHTDPEHINGIFFRLEDAARRDLAGEGISPDRITILRSADIRFTGYPYSINMQFPSGKLKQADLMLLNRAFKIDHQSEFGLNPEGIGAEIAALRLTATVNLSAGVKEFREKKTHGHHEAVHAYPGGTRKVIYDDIAIETPVYDRGSLKPFIHIKGPAVVDQEDTTTVIWPGMSASTDAMGNIIIEVEVK